ncbi:MFS transporter permease [Vibrio comitans]|uniref:Transporter n=1 Tax=Vibrio comitans NBRC 102076 TaxID=1219078 RepID=A0A4Y3IK82_9VIBR|nr:MFS transporter permease [Vibrio comitans]GEA59160.1 hypothetical protein VCO01S_03530 [Vibrio comitans NBRC 102076]
MEKSEYGKWIHTVFTGASFAYFLAAIDKVELISSNQTLVTATMLYAVALLLNSVWAVSYYVFEEESKKEIIGNLLSKYWFLRRFNSLSQWSFVFATIALVFSVLEPIVETAL